MTDDARPAVLQQLYYDDANAAVEWLCRVFGFAEESRMSGPAGELFIAVLRCPAGGGVMVSQLSTLKDRMREEFGSEYRDPGTGPWPNPYYSLTVMVPDVDAHFAVTRGEGARILAEPKDQPWGFRDYEVIDLEGRQWNFSQHLRDTEPEDWGASRPGPDD